MSVLFLVCVGLQYNDPDPYIWMPIYGIAALFSWRVFQRKPIHRSAAWIFALFCLAYSVFSLQHWIVGARSTEMKAGEDLWEGLGLLITAVWISVLALLSKRGSLSSRPVNSSDHPVPV